MILQSLKTCFLDLDAPKRSPDRSSSTQPGFIDLSFAQRVRASVPRRSPDTAVPPETPQPVGHGKVAPVTPPWSRREAMPSPPFEKFSCRREGACATHVVACEATDVGACDATRGIFDIYQVSEAETFSVPLPHPTSSAPSTSAVLSTLPTDPVDRNVHVPTQFTKVTENQQSTRSPMIHSSLMTLL